jgi:hypothetical protein
MVIGVYSKLLQLLMAIGADTKLLSLLMAIGGYSINGYW